MLGKAVNCSVCRNHEMSEEENDTCADTYRLKCTMQLLFDFDCSNNNLCGASPMCESNHCSDSVAKGNMWAQSKLLNKRVPASSRN